MQIFNVLTMALAVTPGTLAAPISKNSTDLAPGLGANNTLLEECTAILEETSTLVEEVSELLADSSLYSEDSNTSIEESTTYPEEEDTPTDEEDAPLDEDEERSKKTYTAVRVCSDNDRRGKCVQRRLRDYECENWSLNGSISSVQLYIASKCKFYRGTGCQDWKGMKQLEVDYTNAVLWWNMGDYKMDNKVKSVMCFDYGA